MRLPPSGCELHTLHHVTLACRRRFTICYNISCLSTALTVIVTPKPEQCCLCKTDALAHRLSPSQSRDRRTSDSTCPNSTMHPLCIIGNTTHPILHAIDHSFGHLNLNICFHTRIPPSQALDFLSRHGAHHSFGCGSCCGTRRCQRQHLRGPR